MDQANRPIPKRLVTMREHLAGVKGSQRWIQELVAEHLLDSESPIKDQPVPPRPAEPGP